ncbi:DNA oxidative demethylase ALKBH2-like [Stegodyphus dumicola]|uniref:DNA oxidative demethylase ALKBH2-like n=1 Tax=Stegodyphus dumicola TaxID=202533 RepID=UPI0015A883EE|nr:DNA oxidative demethylase ALKBH2-like [Stegodyphus dumicola]
MSISCQPWTPLLFEIKASVEHLSGANFNFVLINRYKDGNSCIGQHKDNEPSLDSNHPVCSLSLGETRTIVFKRQHFQDYRLELENNSLLILSSPTNELWTHGIPRQKERKGVRVSLTFRRLLLPGKRKFDEDQGQPKKGMKYQKVNDI